ncbi:MAG: hypothetical protein O2868_18520 [Proteobacteria bacterium]|nr:hypothetical protein [Pseudomonadota bacterium]
MQQPARDLYPGCCGIPVQDNRCPAFTSPSASAFTGDLGRHRVLMLMGEKDDYYSVDQATRLYDDLSSAQFRTKRQ